MILIADSGSTKCSWAMCDMEGNLVSECNTIGFNPYFVDDETILEHLNNSELAKLKDQFSYVFFYGAGCSSDKMNTVIQEPFRKFFSKAEVSVSHDLDASCYAVYNNTPVIACILGTGSNSCYFDGKTISEAAPSLGYILSDEASGNNFGKKILSLYFNNLMPDELKKILENEVETDLAVVNKRVYAGTRANAFLASYFPFIVKTKNHPMIKQVIDESFDEFVNLHVKCYDNFKDVEVSFIGSVSHFLADELHEAAQRHGFKIGKIIKNPIQNLIKFHHNKINLKDYASA